MAAERGIGASGLPREDRFLRDGGPYVGDVRMAGTREVAFVLSRPAGARLVSTNVPAEYGDRVFSADDLVDVKPAPPLKGFKRQPKRRTPGSRSRPALCFAAHRHSHETAVRRDGRKIET